MTVGNPSRLFILCLPILSLMCDVCHSFYNPIRSVRFDMIVYHRIIVHVHPQILLFDVMLSCSLESVYKSKLKGKLSGFPQGF